MAKRRGRTAQTKTKSDTTGTIETPVRQKIYEGLAISEARRFGCFLEWASRSDTLCDDGEEGAVFESYGVANMSDEMFLRLMMFRS